MKNMKRRFFAALLACALGAFMPGGVWADVKIDARNFPDENFRQWVKENVAEGGDTLTDIETIEKLSIGPEGISSLKGIEFFTALWRLQITGNNIAMLDLAKNTALEWLECPGNELTELILPKTDRLRVIFCRENNLTELDLSGNPNLETLQCNKNSLTALDLSHTSALEELACGVTQIEALDLSHATALKVLHCDFEEIDLSKNPRISELNLSNMTKRLTLPNGDRVDLGKILRLPREDGGDYRLDISGYDGKIEQVLITKWGEDDATPLDVPGGACAFKPADGTMTLLYRIGGETGTLRILMDIMSEPGFEAD